MIKWLKGNQKGITFIEVIVVTALVGTLTGAFSASIFGIFRHTANSNARVTAACGTEEAAHWISNDGQMAQVTDLPPGAATVTTVKFSWTDPDNGDAYEIDYFLSAENLRRQETINSIVQGTRTVARNISSIEFSRPAGDDRLFTANITASGGTHQELSETREYHIVLRAESN
jgi:hypothetical protein